MTKNVFQLTHYQMQIQRSYHLIGFCLQVVERENQLLCPSLPIHPCDPKHIHRQQASRPDMKREDCFGGLLETSVRRAVYMETTIHSETYLCGMCTDPRATSAIKDSNVQR